MFRYLLGLVLLPFCLQSFCQSSDLDSLLQLLEIYQDDTNRVRVLNQLGDAYLNQDVALAHTYGEQALDLAQRLKDRSGELNSLLLLANAHIGLGQMEQALQFGKRSQSLSQQLDRKEAEAAASFLIGRAFYRQGNMDSSALNYQSSWQISSSIDDRQGMGKAAKGLGDIFESRGDYPQALQQYELSLKIHEQNSNLEGQMRAHNAIGIIYESTNKTEEALAKYIETLRLAEEAGNPRMAGAASGNIGSLYFIQKNYGKAIEYAQKALKNYQKINYQRGIAFVYQDMGQILKDQRKLDEALESYQKALDIRMKLKDKRGQSFTYFGIGYTYKHLGDLEKARFYHEKSLALRQEIGFTSGVYSSMRTLARLNMEAGDYAKALPYLEQSLAWNLEANNVEGIYESYGAITEYYASVGDYSNAYAYQKLYQAARDSLFNEDQNEQFADMQVRYETEKKDKEILQQEYAILELAASKSKIEKQRNYFVAGGLLLAIVGFFGFQLNKTRKERNDKKELAEALIFAQEEERKRIARDLHDGIGQSLLLIKRQMTNTREISLENQEMISQTLEEVRSISRDLHPFQLEKFGLVASIRDVISKIENSTDLFISQEIDAIDELIPDKDQIHIFRTVQEALSNIVKHAGATAAKVTIQEAGEEILVKIQDNGKGFDHELTVAKSKSLGLRTMYERISAIGGKLTIGRGANGGTVIDIKVPSVPVKL